MTADIEGAISFFHQAANYISGSGLQEEVEWHRQMDLNSFIEADLLREAAWVILCSGFRESIVRSRFDYISLCFCDWESASAIVTSFPHCKNAALSSFNNQVKLDAIVGVAGLIHKFGFESYKQAVLKSPIETLRQLPFIGPITVWHLAKNLGLNVAKPDRHLIRISDRFGFNNATTFCDAIANEVGEERKVVDLMVWRFMADNPVQANMIS